ncbi:hypothetical protein [Aquimarina agarivorans]|uniref:hypothetical protein n=1 Tax=Aquimarina agarivorans TaxID=980584 RepID=UPI000248EC23|nr:hypothetical protein [Aquimarina agarivorans]
MQSCAAQSTIVVEKVHEYIDNPRKDLSSAGVTRIIDNNNVLRKYEGTWKGQLNGISYNLLFKKITRTDDGLTEDLLILKYHIKNTQTNTTIDNTLNLPDDSVYVPSVGYLDDKDFYQLSFNGGQNKCGISGQLFISVFNNKMGITMLQVPGFSPIANSCNEAVTIFPPSQPIRLIKQ